MTHQWRDLDDYAPVYIRDYYHRVTTLYRESQIEARVLAEGSIAVDTLPTNHLKTKWEDTLNEPYYIDRKAHGRGFNPLNYHPICQVAWENVDSYYSTQQFKTGQWRAKHANSTKAQ